VPAADDSDLARIFRHESGRAVATLVRLFGDIDIAEEVQLYDQLLAFTPTPVVALNRAVAVAELAGPAAALDAIDDLDLDGYAPFHITRGELLARLGRAQAAAVAYDRAIELTANDPERRFLVGRRNSVDDRADPPR
jgi:RNA polymerase sigma-70 factor (ECF subfamily)